MPNLTPIYRRRSCSFERLWFSGIQSINPPNQLNREAETEMKLQGEGRGEAPGRLRSLAQFALTLVQQTASGVHKPLFQQGEALLHELVSQARNEPCLRCDTSSSCLLLAKLNVCRHSGMVGRLLLRPTTTWERQRSQAVKRRAALIAIANGLLIALFILIQFRRY